MIIQTILGLIVLFLPGFFVSRLIVPKADLIERVVLTFGLMIIINFIVILLLTLFSYIFSTTLVNLTMIVIINLIIFISTIIVEVFIR